MAPSHHEPTPVQPNAPDVRADFPPDLSCGRTSTSEETATVGTRADHRRYEVAELTPFEHACIAAGWGKPAAFLRAFDATAQLLGETVTLTDRQARRWRESRPPNPRARAWRVLHAMFGVDPRDLGFPGPPPKCHRGECTTPRTGRPPERETSGVHPGLHRRRGRGRTPLARGPRNTARPQRRRRHRPPHRTPGRPPLPLPAHCT